MMVTVAEAATYQVAILLIGRAVAWAHGDEHRVSRRMN
jgi:hypothetical protein